MDASRATALALAFLACLFVIIAGKSCADNIQETNKLSHKQTTEASTEYSTIDNTKYLAEHFENEEAANTTEEQTTEKNYIEITNMFGDVIETVPITSEGETVPTTKELSILEGYNQKHQEIEGEDQEEGTEETTFDISGIEVPSKIEIVIE